MSVSDILRWLDDHQGILWGVGAASFALLLASVFVIPLLVARIRPDYFAHEVRPDPIWAELHPFLRAAIHVGKNALGALLMVAGLAMLFLPGQGLLTLLVGFLLLDLPGKYRFERWLVSRPLILRPINWLRRRAGRQPLQIR